MMFEAKVIRKTTRSWTNGEEKTRHIIAVGCPPIFTYFKAPHRGCRKHAKYLNGVKSFHVFSICFIKWGNKC